MPGGYAPRTTNNRMELTAVIEGLETLEEPCHVRLVVGRYVRHGITEGLAVWRTTGWRCGNGRHRQSVANVRLWQRLDALLQYHRVDWRWVRGHSGHPENELADRLARQAAASTCEKRQSTGWRPTSGRQSGY